MAILLLPHEASKDEPAEQHDISRGFSNRSDGAEIKNFREICTYGQT
jgi:hypothetical protein